METLAIGMFAVVILIVSACFLYCKKPFWSFLSSIVTLALTCWTGYSWNSLLMSSGKDTTLFGFHRYPAALILLSVLLLAALILMIVSIVGMVRQRRPKA